MTRATANAGWEVGLPRLGAVHSLSCMDDHANHCGLMHGIEDALIGMSGWRDGQLDCGVDVVRPTMTGERRGYW